METTNVNTPKRRRLRISLRVFMLVVLVAGVWLGSLVNNARRQRGAVADIKAGDGYVYYDWQYVNGMIEKGTRPPGPVWVRCYVGDEYFQDVVQVGLNGTRGPLKLTLAALSGFHRLKTLVILGAIPVGDEELRHISKLTNLENLAIRSPRNITDEGIAYLKSLPRLKKLHATYVGEGMLTDSSLRHLASLTGMESIALQGNEFTDEGLVCLRNLTGLKELYLGLGKTRFSDEAMIHLAELKNLEILDLQDTGVTDTGLSYLNFLSRLREVWTGREPSEKLRKMLPQVEMGPEVMSIR